MVVFPLKRQLLISIILRHQRCHWRLIAKYPAVSHKVVSIGLPSAQKHLICLFISALTFTYHRLSKVGSTFCLWSILDGLGEVDLPFGCSFFLLGMTGHDDMVACAHNLSSIYFHNLRASATAKACTWWTEGLSHFAPVAPGLLVLFVHFGICWHVLLNDILLSFSARMAWHLAFLMSLMHPISLSRQHDEHDLGPRGNGCLSSICGFEVLTMQRLFRTVNDWSL
jgi:hypothetical protein